MKKIEDIIKQIPQDFKYVKVIDTPCYINTIVNTSDNPYGDFSYYTEPDETYKWHYKLNQVKLSNHRDKVVSLVYNNGINSIEETLDSEEPIIDYTIDDNNNIFVTQSATYTYNPLHQSTHFMIGVDLSEGLSPIIHNDNHEVAIAVSVSYDMNGDTVEEVLTPYEDMLLESGQKSNISYQVVPYRNGFIVKFYGNVFYPSGHTLSFDYINLLKRDIEFTITYNIQVNDDYDPETDVISKYIYYPTITEDEPDTLLLLVNRLTSEEHQRFDYHDDLTLNSNLKVRVAHIKAERTPEDCIYYDDIKVECPNNLVCKDDISKCEHYSDCTTCKLHENNQSCTKCINYDVVQGYVYSDFVFTQQARTNNYEILENLVHEDTL